MLEVSIQEESLINSDDAVDIFSAASTFMRRNLQRTEGYFEHALPGYSLNEFKVHFRLTRGTMEGLCRVVQATGRVPQRHSFGLDHQFRSRDKHRRSCGLFQTRKFSDPDQPPFLLKHQGAEGGLAA